MNFKIYYFYFNNVSLVYFRVKFRFSFVISPVFIFTLLNNRDIFNNACFDHLYFLLGYPILYNSYDHMQLWPELTNIDLFLCSFSRKTYNKELELIHLYCWKSKLYTSY
jgi:hypothetical protein